MSAVGFRGFGSEDHWRVEAGLMRAHDSFRSIEGERSADPSTASLLASPQADTSLILGTGVDGVFCSSFARMAHSCGIRMNGDPAHCPFGAH